MSPSAPPATLWHWFAASADRCPDEPAVEVDTAVVSYRQLSRCAAVLAERMVRTAGGRPHRIGLLASRSLVALAGYLAGTRLGAAVTPLNPEFPAERNRAVRGLAGVEVLLADPAGAAQLEPGAEGVLVLPDDELLRVAADPAAGRVPPVEVGPDDVAYVLFTSGSTGRPKGVPIRHRNVSPYVAHNVRRYEVGPGSRTSHTFDLTFDPSVFDLFVTWAGGGTLVVPRRSELLAPVDYLVDRRITHWFSVPSVVSVAAQLGTLPPGRATGLSHSIFIGEQLTYRQAALWRAAAPNSLLENVYGPTELTVACTEYRLPPERGAWPPTSNDTVPIGQVYEGLDWLVLDEGGDPAGEGELCVRGAQRFDGYLDPADDAGRFLRREGSTAEVHDGSGPLTPEHYYRTGDRVRFEAGVLVHLGRLDNQVKVRGYRIELGEIETVLRRHPQVGEAVVVAVRRGDEVELVGCYTGEPVPDRELAGWLRRRLPLHMVPRRLHRLDAVPLNPNGKVDRGRLRAELPAPAGPVPSPRPGAE